MNKPRLLTTETAGAFSTRFEHFEECSSARKINRRFTATSWIACYSANRTSECQRQKHFGTTFFGKTVPMQPTTPGHRYRRLWRKGDNSFNTAASASTSSLTTIFFEIHASKQTRGNDWWAVPRSHSQSVRTFSLSILLL